MLHTIANVTRDCEIYFDPDVHPLLYYKVLASNLANMTTKTRTYGRGILRFTSWEPCRIPGQKSRSFCESRRLEIDDQVSAVITDKSQLITTVNRGKLTL